MLLGSPDGDGAEKGTCLIHPGLSGGGHSVVETGRRGEEQGDLVPSSVWQRTKH
jgi:hypothetical protein